MIVKLGENVEWKMFRRKSEFVKAIRMMEDFLFETSHGWVQGYKGQWLVEIGECARANMDHESFVRNYSDERRKGEESL